MLKKETEIVRCKVKRLETNCRLTRALHEKLVEVLNVRGIESEEDWLNM